MPIASSLFQKRYVESHMSDANREQLKAWEDIPSDNGAKDRTDAPNETTKRLIKKYDVG